MRHAPCSFCLFWVAAGSQCSRRREVLDLEAAPALFLWLRYIEQGYQPPEIVLVRKSYTEKRRSRRQQGYHRAWTLKRLDMEVRSLPFPFLPC